MPQATGKSEQSTGILPLHLILVYKEKEVHYSPGVGGIQSFAYATPVQTASLKWDNYRKMEHGHHWKQKN